MESERLLRRVRLWTVLFILGLVISGVTAIPLAQEVRWLVRLTGAAEIPGSMPQPEWAAWLLQASTALDNTQTQFPFLFYGTDWLAFGHFMIALVFLGALKDPVRNRWLFTFGILACVLVVPYAVVFGAVRGIPWWWRMIDCSFGVFGIVPLLLCRSYVRQLERAEGSRTV